VVLAAALVCYRRIESRERAAADPAGNEVLKAAE